VQERRHRHASIPVATAVALLCSSAAGSDLPASRLPCNPGSLPLGPGVAHLQLSWTHCDPAQNPLNPFWVDPEKSRAAGSAVARTDPPSTTGRECASLPFRNAALSLPPSCAGDPFWVSVPQRGIQKLSCKRLRYFPDLLHVLFPSPELYGHANLYVVALEGPVRFVEQAHPDLDYNFALLARGGPLPFTAQNPKLGDGRQFIELELFAPESVDRFHSPWWRGLRSAVEDGQGQGDERWRAAREYVGEADAYAVGLFGLDCQHGCAAELHPVYAAALRTRPAGDGLDRWTFFARNSGGEGFCSDGRQIDLGLQYLALVLAPPTAGAALEGMVRSEAWRHPANASVHWMLKPLREGALLLVQFEPADPRSQLVEGEVVLRWR
jgi:hypothetical protein